MMTEEQVSIARSAMLAKEKMHLLEHEYVILDAIRITGDVPGWFKAHRNLLEEIAATKRELEAARTAYQLVLAIQNASIIHSFNS